MKTLRNVGKPLLAMLVGIVLALICQAEDIHLHPSASPIPKTMFGLHIHNLSTTTPWPPIPFGTLRMWDTYTTWSDLEPQRDKWNFDRLDKFVSLAQEHSVDAEMVIGMPPPWASARPAEEPKFRPGSAAEPGDLEDWRNYVRTLATRYKGKIHYWEVWNEPNLKSFYSGTHESMILVQREAYRILKQVDSTNMVISPAAVGGVNGPEWLDGFLRAGGAPFCDIIGFHFYVTPKTPEEMLPLIQRVRAVMRANGVASKELWDTETGWFIHSDVEEVKGTALFPVVPSEEAIGYVGRSYTLAWAGGISRLNWYDWDSKTMALTESSGQKLKAAGYAYKVIEDWLVGARMTACDSDSSQTWICQIERDGGYRGYIVWNPRGTKNFAAPKAWNAQTLTALSGNSRNVKGDSSVQIGIMPILLENKSR